MWVRWDQALGAAVLLALGAALARRRPGRRAQSGAAFAAEAALVLVLYSVWRLARNLPLSQSEGALDRGRDIWELQRALHLPSELTIEMAFVDHEWAARLVNGYYAIAHVPAVIACLVWLFVRHRDRYPIWRNALAIVTAACLVVRFVRVAPPRLLPELGFVDLAAMYGPSVYGEAGTGVSDQFAAMPSIHVAWALLVGWAVLDASTSRWRWLVLLHPALTVFVVVASGNHWWLDGIVAAVLLELALLADRGGRAVVGRLRGRGLSRGAPPLVRSG